MLHSKRMAEYRRRRHQEARRRRGTPRHCPCAADSSRADLPEGSLADIVEALRRRLSRYPGVLGLLYRPTLGGARLHVVAPPPMTRPVRVLAETWVSKLLDLHPGLELRLQVLGVLPEDPHGYRCAFWRGV